MGLARGGGSPSDEAVLGPCRRLMAVAAPSRPPSSLPLVPGQQPVETLSCDGTGPPWAWLVSHGSPWRPNVGRELYVGNPPYGSTDDDLHNLFGPHGTA